MVGPLNLCKLFGVFLKTCWIHLDLRSGRFPLLRLTALLDGEHTTNTTISALLGPKVPTVFGTSTSGEATQQAETVLACGVRKESRAQSFSDISSGQIAHGMHISIHLKLVPNRAKNRSKIAAMDQASKASVEREFHAWVEGGLGAQ